MSTTLEILILIQIALGAFDTLWHHEFTERLAWRAGQEKELRLHGVRNLIYALVFVLIGWWQPQGLVAAALIMLLVVELFITLWDFVEEDRSRRLPATERVTHTLLTLNYGLILALLVPLLLAWVREPTGLAASNDLLWGAVMSAAALGVGIFGVRDLFAARRLVGLKRQPASALLPGAAHVGHVLVTGATGFIGTRLVEALVAGGARVTVLVRDPRRATHLATPVRLVTSLDQIGAHERIDAIVNLAGEPIAGGLWTRAHKERLRSSRLGVTEAVVQLVTRLATKPQVVISGSAIGIHGLASEDGAGDVGPIVEDGSFGQRLCLDWEAAAQPITDAGVRLVLLRTGLVIGHTGGSLGQMLFPFEMGIGGPFGSGRNWMSWIGLDDMVRLIGHCLGDRDLVGPVLAVAPNPVTNAAFARTLGKVLNRPAILPVPAWLLTSLLGDMARELFLASQKLVPRKLLEAGFEFRQPTLEAAMRHELGFQ